MSTTANAADEPADTDLLKDPYRIHASGIKEPPEGFWRSLRFLGPGFILSASIVGSGELIATTLLGAQAGFILLWFIIFSCLVKVAVQLEFGRHAISSGESTMLALNSLPGPRLGSANWSIWTWLILMSAKMLQVGGIVGGVVEILKLLFPLLAEDPYRVITTYGVGISVSLLVYRGFYRPIEKFSLIMIGLFTLFTFASLMMLQTTDLAIQPSELVQGLTPAIPPAALAFVAIGAFGITGVGGDEIMAYNYWLIEKGYAAYVGPKDDSPGWYRRARGWIRVMHYDAILAMVAYTVVTAMFYLLGAAVLHRQGILPKKATLIPSLATMYTDSLGDWARVVFLVGAIVVLYSTLFAALAAWTRMFSDAFGRIGLYRFEDHSSRYRAIAIFAWLIPIGWATLYLAVEDPGKMVLLGGVATTVILVIVVYASLYFRYRRSDKQLVPSRVYDIALWLSAIAILIVAGLGARDIYGQLQKPNEAAAPSSETEMETPSPERVE